MYARKHLDRSIGLLRTGKALGGHFNPTLTTHLRPTAKVSPKNHWQNAAIWLRDSGRLAARAEHLGMAHVSFVQGLNSSRRLRGPDLNKTSGDVFEREEVRGDVGGEGVQGCEKGGGGVRGEGGDGSGAARWRVP